MSDLGDWLREQAIKYEDIPEVTGVILSWNFGDKFSLGCVKKDSGNKEQAEDLLEGLSEAVTKKYGE